MGRPRTGAKKVAVAPDTRRTAVNIKGTDAYLNWLETVHRKTHIPKATIFRVAAAEWAERNNLPVPPEM